MTSREYTNTNENQLVRKAEQNGWTATKRGWPDFLLYKDGEYICVEVKHRQKNGAMDRLKTQQIITMQLLTDHGIKCYVSDGNVLEPFDPNVH